MADRESRNARNYAPDRISIRALAFVVCGVFASIATATGIAFWIFGAFSNGRDVASIATHATAAPGIAGDVRLQVDPASDIASYLREKRALLDDYAWVDRDKGIARIPIAVAMRLRTQGVASAKGTP